MKKILCLCLAVLLLVGLVACGNGGDTDTTPAPDTGETTTETTPEPEPEPVEPTGDQQVLNVWSFTDEFYTMLNRFFELNPELAERYVVNYTEISTTDGAYQPALDMALAGGGADAPDIWLAESAFVLKYSQGEASHFAATYADLGIDVASAIAAADIAGYTVDIGTRPSDNQVVALGFQATGGAFIYRRSIAESVFGTDDPVAVASEIGPGWDRFWEAAETLGDAGYAIVSGDGDLWHPVRGASPRGWIDEDGYLYIDPSREAFLDMSMRLMENGWHNDTEDWSDSWFADFRGEGAREVFGFFGPAWLVNYVLGPNAGPTYGDWGVAVPPEGFFWGGTWVFANRDTPHTDVVRQIIEWVTLDATTTGLQYEWANGILLGTKDVVASGVVMDISDGRVDILDGQDMFDVFIPANDYARADNMTEFDESINLIWRDRVRQFTGGHMTRDEALESFRQAVADELFIFSR
ncbi:MAG: extracellular solute-binding protein [Oscillospiraceae bacterium]|nr:extracellular solute-binding protein [Oscillospiraceae bacterium]